MARPRRGPVSALLLASRLTARRFFKGGSLAGSPAAACHCYRFNFPSQGAPEVWAPSRWPSFRP
eukprot:8031910-Pyramimonas_sp.AAC.1